MSNNKKNSIEINETESLFWDKIPLDWNLVSGSDIFEVNPSYSAEGKIDYIGMKNLDTESPLPSTEGSRSPENYSGKLFKKDDVIFPRITPCVENGKRGIIKNLDTKYGIGSTEFIVLAPFKDEILPWYLFYLVNSHVIRDYAISRMRGSTGRQRVPYSVFRNEIDIALPPISEQRKIASVLYNVDQAIQKTEEIIEQTQRVKKGLMQDLFTEGYFEHYKFEEKEPLNKRPIEWDTKSLNEIAEIEMGSSPKSKYYNHNGEGLPFYQGNNEFGERYPNTKVWCNQPVKTANKNDILISVRAPVGDLNITPKKCCIGRGLASITTKNIDKNYLFYHLKERKNYLIRISAGSTYDSINSSQLKNLNLKIPPLKEQQKVAEILMELDNKINSNRKQKHQLQRIKKGLMQDLLTGKVRTKDKDIEILKEVLEVED